MPPPQLSDCKELFTAQLCDIGCSWHSVKFAVDVVAKPQRRPPPEPPRRPPSGPPNAFRRPAGPMGMAPTMGMPPPYGMLPPSRGPPMFGGEFGPMGPMPPGRVNGPMGMPPMRMGGPPQPPPRPPKDSFRENGPIPGEDVLLEQLLHRLWTAGGSQSTSLDRACHSSARVKKSLFFKRKIIIIR